MNALWVLTRMEVLTKRHKAPVLQHHGIGSGRRVRCCLVNQLTILRLRDDQGVSKDWRDWQQCVEMRYCIIFIQMNAAMGWVPKPVRDIVSVDDNNNNNIEHRCDCV